MSNKKAKARYSTREYLGMFERFILVMRGRSPFYNYDRVLERLFAMFPNKTGCEQFISTDISDYKIAREQKGIDPLAIKMELFMIYRFWQWLTVDKNLPIWNPAKAYRDIQSGLRPRVNQDLCLADIDRLIAECPTIKDKQAILIVLQGGKVPRGKARKAIQEAAVRVGLVKFSFQKLRTGLKTRLAQDIIKLYCEQVSKTFSLEPELNSDTLTAIKLTILDERPAISNSNDNLLMSAQVD